MPFSRRKNKGLIYSLIILALAAALVLVWPRGRGLLTRTGLFVYRPVSLSLHRLGQAGGGLFYLWHSKKDLQSENFRLKQTLASLAAENSLLRGAAAENDQLNRLLDWKKQHPRIELTAARVIGYVPEEWQNKAIIDKGRTDGLTVGLGVVSPDGIVGRLIEVRARTSLVLLFTDTTSSFAAACQRTGDRGLVTGRLCFPPLVNYISQGNDIQPGDYFVTAAGGQYFPAGIPIGQVIKKKSPPYGLFDQIYLQPAVRISQLDGVFIVRSFR